MPNPEHIFMYMYACCAMNKIFYNLQTEMTVNGLTKVNVGGTMHAPLSCNPRTRGRVVAGSRASPYLFFFCFEVQDGERT